MLIQLGNKWIKAENVSFVMFSQKQKTITVLHHDEMQAVVENATQEMADEFVCQVNEATRPIIHHCNSMPKVYFGGNSPPIYSGTHQQ